MSLPDPPEQRDNLIRYLGRTIEGPGEFVELSYEIIAPKISALGSDGAQWIVDEAARQDLVHQMVTSQNGTNHKLCVRLKALGWDLYSKLVTDRARSRQAFMAMQFGDADLNAVLETCFKPACLATGFALRKLDDEQRAGLIDDRLRVEIRRSRFLIADLTHQNRGAYWEAGFAEGLGIPVIYTCREYVFKDNDSAKKPHFDTNHHLTIQWHPNKLEVAQQQLTDVIRATLPDEANL